MTNDISDGKPAEEDVACIALSKNDSSVMFASGGKVSLYDMMTFMIAYSVSGHDNVYALTFGNYLLAFHPQANNIIAIGMEDSTIEI
ncbi:hypothetical protein Pint_21665 [Pistacia integerrima]|uniref:Uncharacterized protein n=1 Tax=Pistacia integerrima TaxID=434235 RepID=A0ACC0X8Y8_9ROSI|nr:hypothetical protein Pint_21665 [Pistacia integerrima]